MIEASLRFVYLLALTVWIGAIVFFSLITAPALFGALPRDMAGRATAAIFPRYYLLGAACGLAAIAAHVVRSVHTGDWGRLAMVELVLLLAMTGLTLYAGEVVLPEADGLRPLMNAPAQEDGREAARARFAVLHRRSVGLNGAVLLLGLATLAVLAARGSPAAG